MILLKFPRFQLNLQFEMPNMLCNYTTSSVILNYSAMLANIYELAIIVLKILRQKQCPSSKHKTLYLGAKRRERRPRLEGSPPNGVKDVKAVNDLSVFWGGQACQTSSLLVPK